MRCKTLVSFLFAAASIQSGTSHAAVATEATQIANRILIADLVKKSAAELKNWAANLGINFQQLAVITEKLGQVILIKQQLDQLRQLLSPDQLMAMLKNELGVTSIEEFISLANDLESLISSVRDLQLDFNVILREATISQEVADRLRERGYDVNPDDYFQTLQQLAMENDREAIRRMEFFNAAIQSARNNITQIRTQSESIAKYEGLTEAMQALNVAVLELSGSLKNIQAISAAQGTEEVRIAQALTTMAEREKEQEYAAGQFFLTGSGFMDRETTRSMMPNAGNKPPNNTTPPPNNPNPPDGP